MQTIDAVVVYVFQLLLGIINFADQLQFKVAGSDLILISAVVLLVVGVYLLSKEIISNR
jgi:ABC-type nickel/cobalt efflux system permease component RcnA